MLKPDRRTPAPNFRLPSLRGDEYTLNQYRHRQPVVLIFLPDAEHPSVGRYLHALAASYTQFRAWQAQILVIISNKPPASGQLADAPELPFLLLIDADNAVRKQYIGEESAAVFVLDRFNAPVVGQSASDADELMSPEHALSWVAFCESECPE